MRPLHMFVILTAVALVLTFGGESQALVGIETSPNPQLVDAPVNV